jgi:hypothetical protein
MNTNTITRLTVALTATVLSAGLAACSGDAPAKDTNGSGDPEPTTSADRPDAGAAAASFMEASYAYDLDRAAGMFADDAEIDDSTDLNQWRVWRARDEAYGTSLADLSCREGSTSPDGTQVRCSYAIHSLGSDQLGRGPYDGAADLTVLDGKITSVVNDFPFMQNGFSAEMWEPFQAWVAVEHPASAVLINRDENSLSEAELNRFLRAWERCVAEYVDTYQ